MAVSIRKNNNMLHNGQIQMEMVIKTAVARRKRERDSESARNNNIH